MPVLEVSCPGCGAKLKAPDTMAGKKAKCKKCGAPFRIPGAPAGESIGEPQALSVLAMPVPPLPDDDVTEVMMAEAVDPLEVTLPLPTNPPPATRVAALPSADPFDFSKPAPAAKPAFGAARAAPATKPAPKPAAPAPAKVVAAPAKAVAPAPPPVAAAKPAAQPLSLDDDDFHPVEAPLVKAPAAKAKAAPAPVESAPADDSPFAFSNAPEAPANGQRRDEKDDEPPPTRKARKKTEADEPTPAKSKAKSEPKGASGGGGFNPFADFGGEPDAPAESARRDEDDGKPRKNRKGDEDEPESPRYRRQDSKGSLRKTMMLMGMIGGVALLLGLTAIVVHVRNNRKEAEQAREEKAKEDEKKKEEQPPAGAPADPAQPPKVDPPKNPDPKPKDKNPDPKPKDKNPDPKTKPKDKDPDPPPGTRPTIALPRLKPFTVAALPAAPAAADRPRARTDFEVPLAAIKRVFPPPDPKTGDACVLIQTNAGFNGKGEKLVLDSYGPAGNRIPAARIEYDGDSSTVPIADLSASPKGVFFLAATAGKLTVWAVADKSKMADAVDPYADKPEHAKAGLAAAYFAADPTQVVTVSTAGAVLLYDLPTRKAVSEFVPPHGVPGKVAQGLSVARADRHESVAVAVAGAVYQVRAAPGLEVVRKFDLEGDVGRSLGLAVSGTPGRLLYAFETAPDKAGKKEKAVLGLPLGDTAKHVLHPIPATAGEPKGALWANETTGGVILERGVLLFDDDEGKFVPLVVAQAAGPALYYGDEKFFWYVVPDPKAATKSVLVALSVEFNDRADFQGNYPANKPLRTVRLDANGLAK